MSTDKLIGLRLESFRVTKSAYYLEFDGNIGGEHRQFIVSSSYNLCHESENIDTCENVSKLLWQFLEKNLVEIKFGKNEVFFKFEKDLNLRFWQEENAVDNLLIVNSCTSKDWFTIL